MRYILLTMMLLFVVSCTTERSKFEPSDQRVIVTGCEELKDKLEKEGKEADC